MNINEMISILIARAPNSVKMAPIMPKEGMRINARTILMIGVMVEEMYNAFLRACA